VDHLTCSESLHSDYSESTRTVLRSASNVRRDGGTSNYIFVDNVRFISMAAIVALHSFGLVALVAGIAPSNWLLGCLLQLCKFGTLGFFLISGFLMEESLRRRRSTDYLARRIKTTFLPWLIWFGLYTSLALVNRVITGRLNLSSSGADYLAVLSVVYDLLFSTAYWFVPNLLLAICVLLLCRRHLASLWLGAVLLLASFFYGIDAYTQWIPGETHTKALFGYVFYLWLGAWAARNFNKVEQITERIPWAAILATPLLFGMAALIEGLVLYRMGNPDSLNTLRISNQAYSVAVTLALFKARKSLSPKALRVRSTTFGIYLSHPLLLGLGLTLAKRSALPDVFARASHLGTLALLVILLCAWSVAYACSLALTHAIANRPHLCWLVGVRVPRTLAGSQATLNEAQHEQKPVIPRRIEYEVGLRLAGSAREGSLGNATTDRPSPLQ